jgi:uncharacterized protein YqfB (UPF0267 family)
MKIISKTEFEKQLRELCNKMMVSNSSLTLEELAEKEITPDDENMTIAELCKQEKIFDKATLTKEYIYETLENFI